MHAPTNPPPPAVAPTAPLGSGRRTLPAGALSILTHLLFVTVWIGMQRTSPRGVRVEPDRTTGIALVDVSDAETALAPFQAVSESPSWDAETVPASGPPVPDAEELVVDIDALLPTVDGSGAVASPAAAPRSGDLGQAATESLSATGGTTRTGVFGVYGTGNQFVYVFDHSGSMGGFGGRPLAAAKAELTRSLADLDRIHQFQIIFYNERASVFNPDGGRATLQWADEATKQLADAFLKGIAAAGGTQHLPPLKMALDMGPDVIFLPHRRR